MVVKLSVIRVPAGKGVPATSSGVVRAVYQMSVPLLTVAPLPPSPGPSASPGRRPCGSSCQVIAQPRPLPRTTSCLASRNPSVSRSGADQVRPASVERIA